MSGERIENRLIESNLRFQWKFKPTLDIYNIENRIPKYPILFLTCMDPRIDVHRIFELEPGDVFVLRNAGNIITKDMLRSIFIAIGEFNIKNIIVLGHLDCGMTKIKLHELRTKLDMNLTISELSDYFRPFLDELENISKQVSILRQNRKLSSKIQITGMLYDVNTGYVFENDILNKYRFKEEFYNDYLQLIENKKEIQLSKFKNWKKSIDLEEEVKKSELRREDEEIIQEPESIDLIKDSINENAEFQLNTDQSDIFKINFPQVKIPKITFPKITIHVPMLYKKKPEK